MKDAHRNILLIAILVFLDQLTKYLALSEKILFDTKYLAFNLVKNTGSSFGMLQGASPYLIWVSVIFLGLIIYIYDEVKEKEKLPLMIATAGIIGNLIDRIFFGFVIDFIDLKWWPVFNIADACIVIAVIWILLLEIKD